MGAMLILAIQIIPVAWYITNVGDVLEKVNEMTKGWSHSLTVLQSSSLCMKCVSFWLTLICTQDFILACQVSFLGHLISMNLPTNIKL